jgi:hypothetical protein
MKTPRRSSQTSLSKKIRTTLGDLIAAAYDASEGFGWQRTERAAILVAQTSRARRCSRQLLFVR